MKTMTISEVSKACGVSTRTLRYYEEIGLLPSLRRENYAYRVYDEASVRRLQQILILRKLRIPLKQIASLFHCAEPQKAAALLESNLRTLDVELAELHSIRDILHSLMKQLESAADLPPSPELLCDGKSSNLMQVLTHSILLKEASAMNQTTFSAVQDLRILYLPPCTVIASHFFGENPEEHALQPLLALLRETALQKRKPDLRMYGFNNPSPANGEPYGYEYWVTIPEDFDVPEPFQKKHFPGGLYAAHCIRMGDFQEWQLLDNWIQTSTEYATDPREPFGMGGCLEEHLNLYSFLESGAERMDSIQLDLLLPIREKKAD